MRPAVGSSVRSSVTSPPVSGRLVSVDGPVVRRSGVVVPQELATGPGGGRVSSRRGLVLWSVVAAVVGAVLLAGAAAVGGNPVVAGLAGGGWAVVSLAFIASELVAIAGRR